MNNNIICYSLRRYDRLFRFIRWADGRLCVWSYKSGQDWLYRLSLKTTDRLLNLWTITPICETAETFYAKYPQKRPYREAAT